MSKILKTSILILLFVFYSFFNTPAFAHELQTREIMMTQEGFFPKNINITRGDSVVFKNEDGVAMWPASNIHPTHNIYPEFDPKKPIGPDESWSFTFQKAGIWKYHDHLHPQITGTITVIEDDHSVSKISEPPKTNLFAKIKKYISDFIKSFKLEKNTDKIFSDFEVLALYIRKFGPEQTIRKLHELEVGGLGDCHQTAHEAGRISYEYLGNSAFKIQGFDCHSGLFHGMIEAFFRKNGTSDLKKNLSLICQNEKNAFYSHQCFHGIGHGLMAWSDYEIFDSLDACDLLDRGKESCYSGVFMENVVGGLAKNEKGLKPNELSLHYTNYLSNDPHYPCNFVSEKYRGACYFFQTSRMMQLFGPNFSKISQTCLEAPQNYHALCFSSMGRDASGFHQEDVVSSIRECGFVPYGDFRVNCLTGAVQDRLWDASGQQTATAFCRELTDFREKETCYQTVITRAKEILPTAKEYKQFCSGLEPGYQQTCASQS